MQLTKQIAVQPCSHPNSLDKQSCILPCTAQIGQEDDGIKQENFYETVKLEGHERIYGSPAGFTLLKSLSGHLSNLILNSDVGQNPTVLRTLRHQLDTFPFKQCRDIVIACDLESITTPSRLLVDILLPSYMRNINTIIPIFDELSLRHAINTRYDEELPDQNNVWALIVTNICLLSLGLEVQADRYSQSNSPTLNNDLITSFLHYSDRALARLDVFTRPSILNIQALLTLVRYSWLLYP
jgi:hypothetical protein